MIQWGGSDAGWTRDHEDEAAGELWCQSLTLSRKKQGFGDQGQGKWASSPQWQQCALEDMSSFGWEECIPNALTKFGFLEMAMLLWSFCSIPQ